MVSKTISVLGCGWLGFPLAKKLRQHNFGVKGSTTTQEKFPLLKEEGIVPYFLKCDPQVQGENLKEFFQSSILVVVIPFKRSFLDPQIYQSQIESVISWVKDSTVKFLIFTSSTSVYPKGVSFVCEDTPISPDNERARILYTIEQELLHNGHFDATIVRLAGLYGGQRKIGSFLSGKAELKGGHHPVNLIHQEDCVNILYEIIHQDMRNEIFNAVSDQHPTRAELYTKAAVELGVAPPVFLEDNSPRNKIVDNRKLKERLNYHFLHPNPSVF